MKLKTGESFSTCKCWFILKLGVIPSILNGFEVNCKNHSQQILENSDENETISQDDESKSENLINPHYKFTVKDLNKEIEIFFWY